MITPGFQVCLKDFLLYYMRNTKQTIMLSFLQQTSRVRENYTLEMADSKDAHKKLISGKLNRNGTGIERVHSLV